MTELMRRRRALMGAKAEPNYIVPTDSAGNGTSVGTYTEGNLLHISTLNKGWDNRITGLFKSQFNVKTGDILRLKITRKSGNFSDTILAKFAVNHLLNDTLIQWSTSTNIDISYTAPSDFTASGLSIYTSSNTRKGTNDSHLVEIFINGEQVI